MAEDKKIDTKLLNACVVGISDIKNAPNYDFLVPDIFPRGYVVVMFGEAGCGKTWLVSDTCLNMSNGYNVWNKPTKKSVVLLIEGDAPNSLLKERLFRIKTPMNDDNFKLVNRFDVEDKGILLDLSKNSGIDALDYIIRTHKPDFVVIDTLISFIEDETKAPQIRVLMHNLRSIAAEHNCCILLIHHARKRESKERRNKLDQADLIGSSIISRLASLVISVDKVESNTTQGIIRITKSWFKQFTPLKFTIEDTADGNISITYGNYEEGETKPMKAQSAIIEYIKTHNLQEFSRHDIVEAFRNSDYKETAIRQALQNMLDYGLLSAEGNTVSRKFRIVPITE